MGKVPPGQRQLRPEASPRADPRGLLPTAAASAALSAGSLTSHGTGSKGPDGPVRHPTPGPPLPAPAQPRRPSWAPHTLTSGEGERRVSGDKLPL